MTVQYIIRQSSSHRKIGEVIEEVTQAQGSKQEYRDCYWGTSGGALSDKTEAQAPYLKSEKTNIRLTFCVVYLKFAKSRP